ESGSATLPTKPLRARSALSRGAAAGGGEGNSVKTASVEGGEHIGADQGYTPFAAIEPFRVQPRIFADDQPFLDAATAVDDYLVEPRVAPDENVRQQHRLAGLDVGVDAAIRKQQRA